MKLAEYYPSGKAIKNWGRVQPSMTRFRSWLHGIGRHENTEVWEMSFRDLSALSNWLGTKQYFLGSKPSTVDCMLFGHLAQFLFIDIGFPQKVLKLYIHAVLGISLTIQKCQAFDISYFQKELF